MEWIETAEYVPEDDRIVLVCDAISGFISLARFNEAEHEFTMMHMHEIEQDSQCTHWMCLPEIPKVIFPKLHAEGIA